MTPSSLKSQRQVHWCWFHDSRAAIMRLVTASWYQLCTQHRIQIPITGVGVVPIFLWCLQRWGILFSASYLQKWWIHDSPNMCLTTKHPKHSQTLSICLPKTFHRDSASSTKRWEAVLPRLVILASRDNQVTYHTPSYQWLSVLLLEMRPILLPIWA